MSALVHFWLIGTHHAHSICNSDIVCCVHRDAFSLSYRRTFARRSSIKMAWIFYISGVMTSTGHTGQFEPFEMSSPQSSFQTAVKSLLIVRLVPVWTRSGVMWGLLLVCHLGENWTLAPSLAFLSCYLNSLCKFHSFEVKANSIPTCSQSGWLDYQE